MSTAIRLSFFCGRFNAGVFTPFLGGLFVVSLFGLPQGCRGLNSNILRRRQPVRFAALDKRVWQPHRSQPLCFLH